MFPFSFSFSLSSFVLYINLSVAIVAIVEVVSVISVLVSSSISARLLCFLKTHAYFQIRRGTLNRRPTSMTRQCCWYCERGREQSACSAAAQWMSLLQAPMRSSTVSRAL